MPNPYTQNQKNTKPKMSIKSKIKIGLILICIGIGFMLSGSVFENLEADKIMVIQSPIKGKLSWYTSPGIKWQGFGRVTKYVKRDIYEFKTSVRFNDGGHGTMVGSVQYAMPLDIIHLNSIHTEFGSQKAVEMQLVQTVVNKAIYMTGPLMSSKESYAEKRNYLISYVDDQIQNGVYKTTQKDVTTTDQLTGVEKTVTLVEIVENNGIKIRQEESTLKKYGISTFNFSISALPYDATVEEQIKQQQKITMDIQTAIASAKQAEQKSITVAKEGEANAAKAKWEQEVEKAKAVTKAEQVKEVARLEKEAAEFEKQKQILLGQGEGERKRLVMSADGALDKKLEAWVEVNKIYADAIKGGNWVPSIVMGGSDYKAGSGASDLINLMMAKTAKDLSLDMSVPKK